MEYRINQAFVFLLACYVGFHIPKAAALGCRPCIGRNVSHLHNQTTNPHPIAIAPAQCIGQDGQSQSSMKYLACSRGEIKFPLMPVLSEDVNFNDGAYQPYLDQLSFISCMVYAVDMGQRGLTPVFRNISGVLSVCVNYTSFLHHLNTYHQNLTATQISRLHHFSPETIRWATIITCVIAVLVAI